MFLHRFLTSSMNECIADPYAVSNMESKVRLGGDGLSMDDLLIEQEESVSLLEVKNDYRGMPEPFRSFDYVLLTIAFVLMGVAAVPMMTAWIR